MEPLAKIGFVAQDNPTYAALSVADHLDFGFAVAQVQRSVDHTLTGAASVMQRQM
ncbi:hypothetical protein [Streptomyces sp. LUP30]|uniref:hypothetical protein n=1 Tax=Streptomyces sp. LUP30 TaxID=1890285 RepID=UPI00159F2093